MEDIIIQTISCSIYLLFLPTHTKLRLRILGLPFIFFFFHRHRHHHNHHHQRQSLSFYYISVSIFLASAVLFIDFQTIIIISLLIPSVTWNNTREDGLMKLNIPNRAITFNQSSFVVNKIERIYHQRKLITSYSHFHC